MLKGFINIFICVFLIYFIETKRQGIKVFKNWFKKEKSIENLDKIQTEDLDVNKERKRVSDKLTSVRNFLLKSMIFKFN